MKKLSEVQRSILSAFTVGHDLFSRISLYNMCSDAGSYETFGRQLQA